MGFVEPFVTCFLFILHWFYCPHHHDNVAHSNSITLNTGAKLPIVGYGTWQSSGVDLERGLNSALEAGYRHIDTAAIYGNEDIIGKVLQEWFVSGKLKREDIFITTKLPNSGNRPESIENELNQSLERLQLSYVDMYLIHVPFSFKEPKETDADGNMILDLNTDHIAMWKKMEEMYDNGKTKAIGLSNFNERQIKRVLANSRIPPAMLEVELHVYMQQRPLVGLCKENNITVTSFSTLGSSGSFSSERFQTDLPRLLDLDLIKDTAEKYNKSAAQILLKFVIQQGIAVIPKSLNANRIRENLAITDFKLSEEDMDRIRTLDHGEAGRYFTFIDYFKGIERHPEYPFDYVREHMRH